MQYSGLLMYCAEIKDVQSEMRTIHKIFSRCMTSYDVL